MLEALVLRTSHACQTNTWEEPSFNSIKVFDMRAIICLSVSRQETKWSWGASFGRFKASDLIGDLLTYKGSGRIEQETPNHTTATLLALEVVLSKALPALPEATEVIVFTGSRQLTALRPTYKIRGYQDPPGQAVLDRLKLLGIQLQFTVPRAQTSRAKACRSALKLANDIWGHKKPKPRKKKARKGAPKTLNGILWQENQERGARYETLVLGAIGRLNFPWVQSARLATQAEDHAKIDVVVETEHGTLYLQVKASKAGRQKFEAKKPEGVECVVATPETRTLDNRVAHALYTLRKTKRRKNAARSAPSETTTGCTQPHPKHASPPRSEPDLPPAPAQ